MYNYIIVTIGVFRKPIRIIKENLMPKMKEAKGSIKEIIFYT
jgi:hypothetical protein